VFPPWISDHLASWGEQQFRPTHNVLYFVHLVSVGEMHHIVGDETHTSRLIYDTHEWLPL
jgi:hypothetical protein